jgi:YVTN family beta-propeller protein
VGIRWEEGRRRSARRPAVRWVQGLEIVLVFRILGPLEVVDDGRPISLGGPKQRGVLAILLLHRGEVVSSDRLVDQLWGERPPATAAKTLQGYVSHLRKALGDEFLLTRGGGYLFAAAPEQVDAERFEAIAADARQALAAGDASGARKLLDEALGLWRGEPLADLGYEPFAQREIARLQEARLAAVEDRIDADLALGHHRDLVAELEGLVALHPNRDRLRGELMLALYRSGRQTDALEVYRRRRLALDDELGLEPGPELRALEQRILGHDPTLGTPAMPSPAPRPTERARTARGRGRALIAAGGALLLAAAIATGIVELTRGGTIKLRAVANSLAAINVRSDRVVGVVPVGTRPGAVAFGSGSLWVANLDDQTISRIDPGTLHTLRTIELRGPPTGLATSAGGVWVVESNQTGGVGSTGVFVGRIDPDFDRVSDGRQIDNVIPSGSSTVAAHGNSVWVAPSTGLLTRLNAKTGAVTQRLDPNASPAGIAIGDGAVWLSDTEADDVIRVDRTGLLTPIPVGNEPTGITVGAGSVWVADSLDDKVVRIDPGTRSVTATIPAGRSPAGVAFGAGSVWVANSGDGTVTRIDPKTDHAITIAVGGSPQSIAVVGDRAWVTVVAQSIAPNHGGSGRGTLRMVSSIDVSSLDPAVAFDPLLGGLLDATCAQLVNYPDAPLPAGLQLTPEVAAALPTPSDGGRTYTFKIRPGFRFSPPSDQPVTAETFKDTIERTLNPRMHSPWAQSLADVVGARAYMAGRASHISGVVARGDTLTIRLLAPAPDFLARIAEPGFCAVPSNTPIHRAGVRVIPSAGPYYVASYTPGQGVVLARNPNYHGSRPHHFARIELAVGIPAQRAFREIKAGTADYTDLALYTTPAIAATASRLAARYGPGSPAAARSRQQYFVNPGDQLDYFDLNTHRTLFSDVRVRQAVNYVLDRRALAQLGDWFEPLPERPTDHYLPPGMPGFRNVHVYPTTPHVGKARALVRQAHAAGRTAVLDTCDAYPCQQQAQIVKTDLAMIGLRVQISEFPSATLFTREETPGKPFDLAWSGWLPEYPGPQAMLSEILEDSSVGPTFNDPVYRRKLARAARLSGPKRYLAYGKLDLDLARNAAPLAAFGNVTSNDFFSARIGCQTYGFYGMDLAALCLRTTRQ